MSDESRTVISANFRVGDKAGDAGCPALLSGPGFPVLEFESYGDLRLQLAATYSARSILTGSIRTARITAGRAASNAAASTVSDGNTSIPRSVALT